MAKYLQMDGVDDYIQTPSLSFTKIEIDFVWESVSGQTDFVLRSKSNTSYLIYNGTFMYGMGAFDSVYINGERITTTTKLADHFPFGTRVLLQAEETSGLSSVMNIFADEAQARTAKGIIYNIKFYNGAAIVAHYDMSTGTVNDVSGNGNHATLTGGTWLDDGTGGTTDPGTDGAIVFDSKQIMYSDGFTRSDSRQVLYQDSVTTADTEQILYEISSTSFDMLQEIFNDGQVGQTPFDVRLLLYSDGSVLHDSRQAIYESRQNVFDLQQAIYESGEGKADIHLVLFADSSTHHDLIQSLYEDAAVHFDTKQISFNPDQQKIGTIRLKGKRDLYVYLVAKQELNVPLKAKRELTVPLKGGVNMTMYNQNFTMYSGDTKYITFPIEGADDLTGATITWGARNRSYLSVENILEKSTGNGITVEGSEVKIKLDPVDTELLNGTYHHECELKDNLNNVSTVFTGLMTVNKSAV